MIEQHERLYHLDRPGLDPGAERPAPTQPARLPPGWIALERCNLGPLAGPQLEVPVVLLHPEVGVALLDLGPGETPGAEAALRVRLDAARFTAIFPGTLPIVHLRLEPAGLGRLEDRLREAFAALPPIDLPGGDGWVSVVRRALAPRVPGRGHAPAGLGPAPERHAPPPMLNREVAAQRAGLPPQPAAEPMAPLAGPRGRWPSLPIALGLAGLVAVAAAAAVIWSGPRDATSPAGPANLAAQAPAVPPTFTGPDPAPAPRPAAATPPQAMVQPPRTPEAAPPALPPRDRVAPPGAAAVPAAALPPPAAADTGARVMVRAAANLRAGPGNTAAVLRVVPQGEVLREFSRSPDGWVEVGDTRPQGWIFSKLLVPARP